MNEKFKALGFYPADILLPKDADMTKWAVVACDQFTSQPEYWQAVEETVGDAPSTLRLILPEARLNDPEVDSHIRSINGSMQNYLDEGVFKALPDSLINRAMDDYLARDIFQTYPDSIIYIERTQSDGRVRRGLIGMVDLEQYDFTPGSGALIRATEGTVLSRIPPRVRVRQDAPIELPHVMLLIDDPERTVIEPLASAGGEMEKLYDFDLQQGGGHLAGWRLTAAQTDAAAEALAALCTEAETEKKYGLKGAAPLLFAVGDGNHSLATAKQCYENLKKVTPESERAALPARYALVEVVNNHDDALTFEPIHRVVFGVEPEALLEAFKAYYPGAHEGRGEGQLAVGTLQAFLDSYVQDHGGEIDYIHGDEVTDELGSKPGNIGFKLPAMGKEQLFKTVMADGVLPRKTFSMGHAQDKRYYVEARKIK